MLDDIKLLWHDPFYRNHEFVVPIGLLMSNCQTQNEERCVVWERTVAGMRVERRWKNGFVLKEKQHEPLQRIVVCGKTGYDVYTNHN